MAENYTISTTTGFLVNNNRVFLPSTDINIFPCSRRGQVQGDGAVAQYDPEARLNTERTNRLHTAINGFKDSFIINTGFKIGETLKFVLAGYYIEAKSFDPTDIASDLRITTGTIYAHLSLHSGISLSTRDYSTEILYRQSMNDLDKNYLDVTYENKDTYEDFFVGVSFTADKDARDTGVTPYVLPLFSKSDNGWELVQTSLLPKVEHGETENSIKLSGAFTIKQTVKQVEQTSFEINEGGVGTINVPLHITKGTIIDGGVDLNAGVRAFGLIVGDSAEGDIFPQGTIKAKKHIETPTLEATASIETPLLNVTNEGTAQATIDNATIATASMTTVGIVTANIAKVNATDATITTANIITANIDTADITEADVEEATVTSTLNIHNDEGDAQLNADKAAIANLTAGSIQLEGIGQVPALELAHLTTTDTYRLRFKFGTPINNN